MLVNFFKSYVFGEDTDKSLVSTCFDSWCTLPRMGYRVKAYSVAVRSGGTSASCTTGLIVS